MIVSARNLQEMLILQEFSKILTRFVFPVGQDTTPLWKIISSFVCVFTFSICILENLFFLQTKLCIDTKIVKFKREIIVLFSGNMLSFSGASQDLSSLDYEFYNLPSGKNTEQFDLKSTPRLILGNDVIDVNPGCSPWDFSRGIVTELNTDDVYFAEATDNGPFSAEEVSVEPKLVATIVPKYHCESLNETL